MHAPATIFEVERLEVKFGLSQRMIFELQARFLAAVSRKQESSQATTPAECVLACCSIAPGQPPTLESFIATYMVFSQQGNNPDKLAFLYKWLIQRSPGGRVSGKTELTEGDIKALFQQHGANDATLDAKLHDVLPDKATTLPLTAFQDYMVHKRPIGDLAAMLTLPSAPQTS
ncbi:hypothetical protein H310_09016 [Aphanomyces invadans]|uniref:Uncharacterized protein n=1 Tax=Aphanomyces invadans TaxID=157072 RepID=A0A024TVZ0_9STRA|nr:hypothetical protein H310_09016 [Aphanomyces invadans]ETV98315.1 hypothetical protein H310_09016 [Aphanomyces invadans]|eukprot:XP_008873190.1 hypothetical protein H310_09016 [Aphanomyces invadans]